MYSLLLWLSQQAFRAQEARLFAMPLPQTGVVEFTNAPYPKQVSFNGMRAFANIGVTPAVQPAIGYQYITHSREW